MKLWLLLLLLTASDPMAQPQRPLSTHAAAVPRRAPQAAASLKAPACASPVQSRTPRQPKVGTACSGRQEAAQAVLEAVASPAAASKGPAGTSRRLLPSRTFGNIPHTAHTKRAQLSFINTSSSSSSSSSSNSSNTARLPIDKFFHHLPSPAVPAAWWQLCDALAASQLAGLQAHLAAGSCSLPDTRNAIGARCQLGRQPWVYTFADDRLSGFSAALFASIVQGRAGAAKQLGAPPPHLSRFDLFHGHLFIANNCSNAGSNVQTSILQAVAQQGDSSSSKSASTDMLASSHHLSRGTVKPHLQQHPANSSSNCRVGVLFHASEYPAYDNVSFPIMLGHCQAGSSCRYNSRAMDLRNILWWQGQLAVLDVGEASPLHDLLLHEGTEPLRTVYEEDFGRPLAELLLLRQPHHRRRRRMSAEMQRWSRVLAAAEAAGSQCSRNDGHHGVFVSY